MLQQDANALAAPRPVPMGLGRVQAQPAQLEDQGASRPAGQAGQATHLAAQAGQLDSWLGIRRWAYTRSCKFRFVKRNMKLHGQCNMIYARLSRAQRQCPSAL